MAGRVSLSVGVCVVLVAACLSCGRSKTREDMKMVDLKGKNVVMVIAPEDFRDEEFDVPHRFLTDCGARVTVACSTRDEAAGMLGMKVTPDVLLSDVHMDAYDAVIFVGGGGAGVYFNDAAAQDLAKAAVKQNKLCAAICIAPSILANAGVLTGRKATCFPSERDNLKQHGAEVVEKPVVRDGLIVTGEGPEAAGQFAEMVADVLAGK